MIAYRNRVRLVFLISLLISLLMTIFGIYLPMIREIERNVVKNFRMMAETKLHVFEGTLDKSLEAARSISSRSAIRDKILAYLHGDVTMEDLRSFTAPKYEEGARVIENLQSAVRVVDHEVVATFHESPSVATLPAWPAYGVEQEFRLCQEGELIALDVVSPIMDGDQLLGHDVLHFSLRPVFDTLNTDSLVHFDVLTASALPPDMASYDGETEDVYLSEDTVVFAKPYEGAGWVVLTESRQDLFRSMNALTRRSLLFIFFGYGIILMLLYHLLVSYAGRQIAHLSVDRDRFKRQADKDTLTMAYSRRFLDEYARTHPFEGGSVILMDLDHFKSINDQFGHATGDAVLKETAAALSKSVRAQDLVVRFGGDEFVLLLLQAGGMAYGEEAIRRMEAELDKQHAFPFPIRVSYGISQVDRLSKLATALEEADRRMYAHKAQKRAAEPPAASQPD